MSKLDDLNTLVRLLKDFEFPVSPILEYAIKEKMAQLSSVEEDPVVKPTVEVQVIDESSENPDMPILVGKKKHFVLRVVRDDGSIIECDKAANTLCQVIKEVGVERVFSLKIPLDGMYLVTIGGNSRYSSAQYDVGNGYFVNVHSDNKAKKHQLEKIFKAFNLSWKADIEEKKV